MLFILAGVLFFTLTILIYVKEIFGQSLTAILAGISITAVLLSFGLISMMLLGK